MNEIWKDIKGYEGLYQVSDLGRVRSLKFGKERILSACKDGVGYLRVCLYKDGLKMCLVHRLVAEAFIPNPYGYKEINHKDECKSNNVKTNLEWCNRKYNMNYGTGHERSAKAKMNHPNISKAVYQHTLDGSLIKSYPSAREAERRTGCDQGTITKCCLGKRKQAYGFIWSFSLIVPKGKLF